MTDRRRSGPQLRECTDTATPGAGRDADVERRERFARLRAMLGESPDPGTSERAP